MLSNEAKMKNKKTACWNPLRTFICMEKKAGRFQPAESHGIPQVHCRNAGTLQGLR